MLILRHKKGTKNVTSESSLCCFKYAKCALEDRHSSTSNILHKVFLENNENNGIKQNK